MSEKKEAPCRGCGLPVAADAPWVEDRGGWWHRNCHQTAAYRELNKLWVAGFLAA